MANLSSILRIIEGTQNNDVDKELSKARESLNQEEIKGEETYNGVKVAVNAPVETFPANTKLKIIPIM